MVARFSSASNRNHRPEPDMTGPAVEAVIAEPVYVGVDVSSEWLDIADTQGRKERIDNTPAAIKAAFTGKWSNSATIVCEATGGYERALMDVARQLGLRLRRVHPNRARAFAQASGRLAKTDSIDARMLARFAAFCACEPAIALPNPQSQALAALVSRIGQLTDLRQSETCRLPLAQGSEVSRHRSSS